MKMIATNDEVKIKETGLWEVYHISRDALMRNLTNVHFTSMINKQEDPAIADMEHYTLVATVDLKDRDTWLWRLTNNVDESWSNDFRGEHEAWDMEVHNQEGGMGHRSSMCGDIYYDVENKTHYMVMGSGHAVLAPLDEEE
mgnify:CR=1 FL=1